MGHHSLGHQALRRDGDRQVGSHPFGNQGKLPEGDDAGDMSPPFTARFLGWKSNQRQLAALKAGPGGAQEHTVQCGRADSGCMNGSGKGHQEEQLGATQVTEQTLLPHQSLISGPRQPHLSPASPLPQSLCQPTASPPPASIHQQDEMIFKQKWRLPQHHLHPMAIVTISTIVTLSIISITLISSASASHRHSHHQHHKSLSPSSASHSSYHHYHCYQHHNTHL